MALADDLAALAAPGNNGDHITSPAPSGWEPGVRYEPNGERIVTLPPTPALADEASWTAAVEALGVQVPDGFRVRMVEAKYDPAAWHRDAEFIEHPTTGDMVRTPATTRPVWRYRFVVEAAPSRIDVDELLRAARPRKRTPSPIITPDAYVHAIGDPQIGKSDGDGTAGTVARFHDSLSDAIDRYKRLRRTGKADAVVLPWAGDCIEGSETQGSRLLARLDLTVTEMVRVYRRLMLEQVQAFADLTDDLTVAVVGGNHDEAKRVGDKMATRYDDSWAIEGASQVADVMKAKGRDGIRWLFPGRDGMHLSFDVNGTRMGLLHGHQTRGKMPAWLANKALDRDPIGTSDVVISGHYHTLRLEHLGPTTWMQTGALDGGSTWWQHQGGLSSPPAALTFLTSGGKWHGLEIV